MEIDIKQFCTPTGYYGRCDEPFTYSGRTYATNGHIIVSVPLMKSVTTEIPMKPESLDRVIEPINNASKFEKIPAWEQPPKRTCASCNGTGSVARCPECEGSGEIEFSNSHNSYSDECKTCDGFGAVHGDEIECASCDGKGTIQKSYPINMGNGIHINSDYLLQIESLPGAEIDLSHGPESIVPFRSDGVIGGVMPMRA
ncbi:hypothetical protein BOW53_02865 [Solemya pervernicosa gill symbiont]|uniref:CR-type domain-containing protein n=1 Tax=Solemya pervernicosa gill symbiont TaxID=642797 RepID=A0A1T2L968_9GAMM|nr:hypothetical protein [Solemya pervernicosa gill symbiont]OOZ41637.1 hypothetical protein BOW53_02865 [Solemya pervernicosa gill symbiont]